MAIGNDRPKNLVDWQARLEAEFWKYDAANKLTSIFESLEEVTKSVIEVGGDNNYRLRKSNKKPPQNRF